MLDNSSALFRKVTSAILGYIGIGFTLLNWDFESSGVTALFVAILVSIYSIFSYFVLRRRNPAFYTYVNIRTLCIFAFLLGIIILIAGLESVRQNIATTAALLVFGALTIVHAYIQLIRIKTKDSWLSAVQKLGWLKIAFVIITILFLVAATYDDDSLVDNFGMLWILTSITLFASWLLKQVRFILRLKKEKQQTELLHLKSQVNPHFFFNMLNNLYALVDEDSDKAKQLILSLSDLMRYSIYEGEKDLVPLVEEVRYIENYLELHKMRYHKEIDIQFSNELEDTDIQIMPLIFIILVENAFKHGVEKLRKGAFVHLSLKKENEALLFNIKNNFDPEEETKDEGIGLSNLKRRLELVYPKRHDLTLESSDDIYNATLSLIIK